jgi:hypothetical protein
MRNLYMQSCFQFYRHFLSFRRKEVTLAVNFTLTFGRFQVLFFVAFPNLHLSMHLVICPLLFKIYFQNAHNMKSITVHFIFKTSSETAAVMYPKLWHYFSVQGLKCLFDCFRFSSSSCHYIFVVVRFYWHILLGFVYRIYITVKVEHYIKR